MQLTLSQLEPFPWYVFLIYWTISALRVKPTKVTEELGGRLLHVAVMTLAVYLLFSGQLGIDPLGSRFLPKEAYVRGLGIVLIYLGVALAIWARYSIGQYWSGRVTLKVDHQLNPVGPLRLHASSHLHRDPGRIHREDAGGGKVALRRRPSCSHF